MQKRIPWSEAIWRGCIVLATGLMVGMLSVQACGGRVLQAECKPGMQFCKEAVVCCPEQMVCGTGEPNSAGYTCKLGDCCPPFDAGDEYTPSLDYGSYPGESMTGSSTPPSGGVSAPQKLPQSRQ